MDCLHWALSLEIVYVIFHSVNLILKSFVISNRLFFCNLRITLISAVIFDSWNARQKSILQIVWVARLNCIRVIPPRVAAKTSTCLNWCRGHDLILKSLIINIWLKLNNSWIALFLKFWSFYVDQVLDSTFLSIYASFLRENVWRWALSLCLYSRHHRVMPIFNFCLIL